MGNMTKGAVTALLQQKEVGYFERNVFEVRSFWKETCVEVPNREVHRHVCEDGKDSQEIRLHPFKTIYADSGANFPVIPIQTFH